MLLFVLSKITTKGDGSTKIEIFADPLILEQFAVTEKLYVQPGDSIFFVIAKIFETFKLLNINESKFELSDLMKLQ